MRWQQQQTGKMEDVIEPSPGTGPTGVGWGYVLAPTSGETASVIVSAWLYCPGCEEPMPLEIHDISVEGRVHPSVVCAFKTCGYHTFVRLQGWAGGDIHRHVPAVSTVNKPRFARISIERIKQMAARHNVSVQMVINAISEKYNLSVPEVMDTIEWGD